MDCALIQEAISARLDGEHPALDGQVIEGHLATCTECRSFEAGAAQLHRASRLRPADEVPDLVGAILARVDTPRRSKPEWARYALFAVALSQLLIALPALLFGDTIGASVHIARELGSWDVALAIGLLYAAWRPQKAAGLLPFAGALAATMVLTALLDVTSGRESALGEAHHLLEIVGLALLMVLARPTWRHSGTSISTA